MQKLVDGIAHHRDIVEFLAFGHEPEQLTTPSARRAFRTKANTQYEIVEKGEVETTKETEHSHHKGYALYRIWRVTDVVRKWLDRADGAEDVPSVKKQERLCVLLSLRDVKQTLHTIHDAPASGAPQGRNAMEAALQQRGLFLVQKRAVVTAYRGTCAACLPKAVPKGHVRKLAVRWPSEAPKSRYHSDLKDFVKRDPITGARYGLSTRDHFSGKQIAADLKHKTGAEVAAAFRKICADVGPPKVWITDNGGEFVNAEVKAVMDEYNIDHRTTKPYTPQTNGAAETEMKNTGGRAVLYRDVEQAKGNGDEWVKFWYALIGKRNNTRQPDRAMQTPNFLFQGHDRYHMNTRDHFSGYLGLLSGFRERLHVDQR